MLNQAWTFSVIAQLALYGAIGLAAAALIVLVALGFEVVEAMTGAETLRVSSATGRTREPATVN